MNPDLKAIHGLDADAARALVASLGESAYRADQLLDWIYRKQAGDFGEMRNLPRRLRDALAESYALDALSPVRVLGSEDTTRKFLFRLLDGQLVETVLIPASVGFDGGRAGRRTLCVSSQVGCAYGCTFCASGLDGWIRNLTAGEIVGQVVAVSRAAKARIDNLVFMGMGEPLANIAQLESALRILNADWGLEIGARHITVSTSGLVPQIRRLADNPMQIRLAISLHGATDEVRSRIMPVNRKFPLDALFDACSYWNERHCQKITFEYILIDGVNCDPAQARQLAKSASRLHAKVNLIPYNHVPGLDWNRPSREVCERFRATLLQSGVQATLRREKGHDIAAACGQLRRQVAGGSAGGEEAGII